MTKDVKAKAPVVRLGKIVSITPYVRKRDRKTSEKPAVTKVCICDPSKGTHVMGPDCTAISYKATVGQAFLGKKIGQIARAQRPDGKIVTYKIMNIEDPAPEAEVIDVDIAA